MIATTIISSMRVKPCWKERFMAAPKERKWLCGLGCTGRAIGYRPVQREVMPPA